MLKVHFPQVNEVRSGRLGTAVVRIEDTGVRVLCLNTKIYIKTTQ